MDPSHKETKVSLTAHMFKCTCDAGWTGKNCDTDVDDCFGYLNERFGYPNDRFGYPNDAHVRIAEGGNLGVRPSVMNSD